MKTFLYKSGKSLLPCVLLTVSLGFCYAFSLFAPHVAEKLDVSKTALQFAFCLNIFFLGTGASCFGALVEKNIKRAAWLSSGLLAVGLCVSGLAMYIKSIWIFYLGMGALCGLAEGIGYVTPVKNLLLFFGRSGHKALVMSISIVSFGLGSSFCSLVFKYVFPVFGIENVFFAFAVIYLVMTSVAAFLIDKPKYTKIKLAKEKNTRRYSIVKYIRDPYFLRCWLFMFLNISAGLVVIGRCAGMLSESGISTGAVITVMMFCGFANGFGRLLFPAISDYVPKRIDVLLVAGGIEGAVILCSAIWPSLMPIAFVLINACYGCYFALLPSVLSDRYGNSELSFVHGLCLQSWASASVFAFVLSTFVLGYLSLSRCALFISLAVVYVVNFTNVMSLRRKKN